MANEISIELLHKVLRLDEVSGDLYWRERTPDLFKETSRSAAGTCAQWNAKFAGKKALRSDNGHGYGRGPIFQKYYLAHRVVWALHYGEWPKLHIDHIDRNTRNNKIENLRLVTPTENARNTTSSKNSRSKYLGVYWKADKKRWGARITVNRKSISLGMHPTQEKAARAYDAAARKYFGEFANPNFPKV